MRCDSNQTLQEKGGCGFRVLKSSFNFISFFLEQGILHFEKGGWVHVVQQQGSERNLLLRTVSRTCYFILSHQ